MTPDLPEGWARAKLGDIFDIRYGHGLPKRDRIEGPFPVIGSGGIAGSHVDALTAGTTLVIGRKGSIGTVYVSDGPCWPIDTTFFVDDLRGFHPQYLQHVLQWANLARLGVSTSIPGLTLKALQQAHIPVPPLPEQARIADALDKAAARGTRVREQVAKAEQLLDAARDAATESAATGRFLGEDATSWPSVPISTLLQPGREIVYGITQPGPHIPDGVPFVRVANVTRDGVDMTDPRRIAKDVAESAPRSRLRGGEVLITVVGTIGRTAIVPPHLEGANVARAVAVIPSADEYAEWIRLTLDGPLGRAMVESKTRGTGQPTLNLKEVRSLRVPVPAADIRSQALEYVATLSQSFETISERLDNVKALTSQFEAAVADQAMSGRLVETEAEVAQKQGRNYVTAATSLERLEMEPQKRRSKRPPSQRAQPSSAQTLAEHLSEAGGRLTPEQLFQRGGFDVDDVETFFDQLRMSINSGLIRETRPAFGEVMLEVAS